MSNMNYVLTSNRNFISDDEFYHWGNQRYEVGESEGIRILM